MVPECVQGPTDRIGISAWITTKVRVDVSCVELLVTAVFKLAGLISFPAATDNGHAFDRVGGPSGANPKCIASETRLSKKLADGR